MKEKLKFVLPTTLGVISLVIVMAFFFRFTNMNQKNVSPMTKVSPASQSEKSTDVVNAFPVPTGNVDDAIDAVLGDVEAENIVSEAIEADVNSALSGGDDMTDELGQIIDEKEL